jgi:hypothetical protein
LTQSPRPLGPISQALADRFWSRVNKSDGCWLWTAGRRKNGYGDFTLPPKRSALAHRVAYELTNGPIPDGLHLDHLCRVRHCVNPAHLEPVTAAENKARGMSPLAINARKTHCVRGHLITGQVRARFRRCLQCHRDRELQRVRTRRERGVIRRACHSCNKVRLVADKERMWCSECCGYAA